jgi:hypothetical protein
LVSVKSGLLNNFKGPLKIKGYFLYIKNTAQRLVHSKSYLLISFRANLTGEPISLISLLRSEVDKKSCRSGRRGEIASPSPGKKSRRSELDKLLEAVDTSFHFEVELISNQQVFITYRR